MSWELVKRRRVKEFVPVVEPRTRFADGRRGQSPTALRGYWLSQLDRLPAAIAKVGTFLLGFCYLLVLLRPDPWFGGQDSENGRV